MSDFFFPYFTPCIMHHFYTQNYRGRAPKADYEFLILHFKNMLHKNYTGNIPNFYFSYFVYEFYIFWIPYNDVKNIIKVKWIINLKSPVTPEWRGRGRCRGEWTVGAGQRGRVLTALDGWEGMSVGAWVGGLVASIVGGWWPSGIWRGTSGSPAGCGIQGGGPDRGERTEKRRRDLQIGTYRGTGSCRVIVIMPM